MKIAQIIGMNPPLPLLYIDRTCLYISYIIKGILNNWPPAFSLAVAGIVVRYYILFIIFFAELAQYVHKTYYISREYCILTKVTKLF